MGEGPQSLRYLHYVRDCLRRRGKTREDADDLVQEAFLRLELYCREGHEVVEPEAFLMRTALNLSVSHHRRQQASPIARKSIDSLEFLAATEAPDEVFAAEERLEHIKRILDAVSRRARDAFFLHRLGGFSYVEIAKRLGVSVSTIEKDIAGAAAALALERQKHER
jgi:RNA polymerase sigma factor (sigma-70 family)